MSSSAAGFVPAWLVEPRDANDLVDEVWPETAARNEAGELVIGGVGATDLAARFGTPLYVLDEDVARVRARRTRRAIEAAATRHGTTARVYYAGKAFLSADVVRWMLDEGLNVDVCTGGELAVAMAAGADPARLGFHGNNKSEQELAEAVAAGVGSIIVDSADEIARLARLTADRDPSRAQGVLLRVNSGIHAETHDFLATAHEDQKFGVPLDEAPELVARLRALAGVRFLGLHSHIGSQIFGTAGFRAAAARIVAVHARLCVDGPVPMLNLGGGFGIAYTRADDPSPIDQLADEILASVAAECDRHDIPLPKVAFEPGRSIIGPAGVTLYRVGTTKPVSVETPDGPRARLYVSVDGGMSDNARPALYGAQYSARLAGRVSDEPPALVRVVGKHCESGDIVVDAEYLPGDVGIGDLLAVPATGAYCFSLANTYNWVPRPPVVAVGSGGARTIVRALSVADLLRLDEGVSPTGEPATEGIE